LIIFLFSATRHAWSKVENVECDYSRKITTCVIANLILEENDEIHISNPSDNVRTTSIYDSKILCFPCGIDRYFLKIKTLNIHNSTLKEFSFKDLQNFTSIKNVHIKDNIIGNFMDEHLVKFNENNTIINLEKNKYYFKSSMKKEATDCNYQNILIFVLICLLIGTNVAFFIALRHKSQIKTTINSQTELTEMHYEEVNKYSILNPFNEIKHENLYSEDTNYEEIVHTKSSDDEDFYAEIPLNIQDGSKSEIVENKNESLYAEM